MFRPEIFAENLYKFRKQNNLSQKELAAQLFLSTQAVSKWERGESMPDLANLCKLSEMFNVSVDILLGNYLQKEKTLIAIDGGGTKTEFVLITQQGTLLKRLVLSGSNPNICGIDAACAVLKEGIDTLLQIGTQVVGIFVGGSGMGSGNNAQVVSAGLKAAYPKLQIHCDTDIFNVFACSKDPENCIAVICGTGSVVYANHNGTLIRAGGAGCMLDKLGSGYDVGREALLAALEQRDGTGPETCLTDMVEGRIGGPVWLCIHKIYKEEPSYIASFAPMVLEAYTKDDPVAIRT